jgi:hypothetical protein
MIACIGWGLLIWDRQNLDVDEHWRAEVKHPDEILGVQFISYEYATKVLPLGVLVACGAPAFVRSPNYFRLAIRT